MSLGPIVLAIVDLAFDLAMRLAKTLGANVDEVKKALAERCTIDGSASDAVAAKIDAALPGG